MMDWREVEKKLQEQVEDVCRHLLPNGHKEGVEWTAGSLAGENGNSLKINLAACRTYVHVLNSKPEDSFYGVLILGGIDWTLQNRSFNVDGILSPTDC
jgi:hypothetical protein